MSQLRSAAKYALEAVLAHSGAARLLGRASRSSALILAYHNIVPEGSPVEGDRSLHLPQRRFAKQLDLLLETHDVVPLDALNDESRRSGRPRAAVTFDDAYRGTVTAGIAELVDRRLPATIFVAPAFIGGRSFWWDAVNFPADERSAFREHALNALGGDDARVRREALARRAKLVQPHPDNCAATEAELHAAACLPGITLGSHTWSHPNLIRTTEASLTGELARPLAWLRERFDAAVPWLAYPYGLSTSAVEKAAAAAGYVGAFRVSGGRIPVSGADPFALPRLNVPAGLSDDGFRLRLSGLFC